jgi:hypothetical protein
MRMVQVVREMSRNRPPLRNRTRVGPPAPRLAARPTSKIARKPKGWHREKRRGAIAAVVTVTFILLASLSGYGLHAHMKQSAARIAAHDLKVALETGAALQKGEVLFVPQDGNVCRRRVIDNASWTLRDAGEIPCDDEVFWNSNLPEREHKVERRLDAIRNMFQSRTIGGKVE